MSLKVLHVTADEVGSNVARAMCQHDARASAASTILRGTATGAGFEASCLATARAFATAIEGSQVADVVVAHGWPAAVGAERIASKHGAALVVSAPNGPADEAQAELAGWAAPWIDRFVPAATGDLSLAEEEVRGLYATRERHGEGKEQGVRPADAERVYDVVVRPDGLPRELVETVMLRLQRFAIQKGGTRAEWRATCARSRLALLGVGAADLQGLVGEAAVAGCLPLVMGGPIGDLRFAPVTDGRGLDELAGWLSDPAALSRRLALARDAAQVGRPAPRVQVALRALRLVLNHGGLVADELRASLAPLGWELRPLLGAGRDPLPAADLLIVLPYGDPRGALESIRRAIRTGVPTAFWNVEDPRYYHDSELGPLVQDAAKEATATFSTTTQLAPEYRAHGVELHYLPNFGRGHFHVERPLPDDERTVDVVFLGTPTPERREFLERYRAALGPEVVLVTRDDVRDPVALRDLVTTARLGLSVGTMTDALTPRGPIRGEGLTERLFDYPLAGTPVLSDARAHLAGTFVDGEDLLVFQDVESAVALTRSALGDSARRAALAANARRKVLAQHLGRHRLLSIVEVIGSAPGASPLLAAAAQAARTRLARGGTP